MKTHLSNRKNLNRSRNKTEVTHIITNKSSLSTKLITLSKASKNKITPLYKLKNKKVLEMVDLLGERNKSGHKWSVDINNSNINHPYWLLSSTTLICNCTARWRTHSKMNLKNLNMKWRISNLISNNNSKIWGMKG